MGKINEYRKNFILTNGKFYCTMKRNETIRNFLQEIGMGKGVRLWKNY